MSSFTIPAEALRFINQDHGLFINNQWMDSSGSAKLEIINPATTERLCEVAVATEDDVSAAVQAARKAFKHASWSKLSPAKREALLYRFAQLLEEEHETIAAILTSENGKLFPQSKSEVLSAAATFKYYAGWCTKIEGEVIDISLKQAPGKQNFTFLKRQPIGVVAAIVPWNFPISIASWKLAPLLAVGCTTVLKPSEVCPISSLYFASLFKKAGFPAGVVNLVTGDASTGAALTSHPGIDKITFTGSTAVGKRIGKAAMDNLTEVSLELGGKSPAVVFEDADLEEAAKAVAMGIFRNGGQVCVAGSRAYVQESIYDSFCDMLKSEAEALTISHGFDEAAGLGPLVSATHLERVCSYVEKGRGDLNLVTGGQKAGNKGYYLQPTIFKADSNTHLLASEEIFGPVLIVIPFSDIDDALEKANDSKYGLSSAVWTRDISKAMKCIDVLDAGWVFVNSIPRSDPHFPIGGNKHSGIGRELGKTGLYNFTKLKSVNIVY